MRSTSSEKYRPKSAFGQQFAAENQEISKQIREKGAAYFDIKSKTKQMEQELKAMENRIQKLRKEEHGSVKRLEKTQNQCETVINNKMRHQNDLIEKEYKKQQDLAQLAQQRMTQTEARTQQTDNILRSIIATATHKNKQAQDVKHMLKEANEVYDEETSKKNEVRDQIINDIKELRRRIVDGRKTKEEAAKEFALIINHNNKLQNQGLRQDEIERRLMELTHEEEALLDRIRATNTLQESTYQKMEKVFSMRVSAEKPLDLPE